MTALDHVRVDKDYLEAYAWRTGLPIEYSADENRAYIRTPSGYLYAELTVEAAS